MLIWLKCQQKLFPFKLVYRKLLPSFWCQLKITVNIVSCYYYCCDVFPQTLLTREDSVAIVQRPDGTLVTEHADGTRITTKPPSSSSSSPSVIIECPGFSRVTYQSQEKQSSCSVQLPGSMQVTTKGGGEYSITGSNGTPCLFIASSGEVTYASVNSHGSQTMPCYTLNHAASEQLLDATDSAGNHYSVDCSGQIVAHNSTASGNQLAKADIPTSCLPRFFILRQDGSAYELHHKEVVTQVQAEAGKSPDVVCVKGSLPQNTSIQYSTLIKPRIGKMASREKLAPTYTEESFIPANLQVSQSLNTASSSGSQNGRTRSKFGVGFGKHLNTKAQQPRPKFVPPSCLQYRQFIHLSPLTSEVRESLLSCVAKYIDWRAHQENTSDKLLPVDQRSNAEKEAASNLMEQFIGLSGTGSPQQLLGTYQKAWQSVHYPPRPPTPPKESKMPEAIQQLQRDIQESKLVQQTIRNGVFPPYFESDKGVQFLRTSSPDMAALASKLPPHRPNKKSFVSFDLPSMTHSEDSTHSLSPQGEGRSYPSGLSTPTTLGSTSVAVGNIDGEFPPSSNPDSPIPHTSSLSKVRPSNPTPTHAHGDGSPTHVRPMNPTPHQAAGEVVPANDSSDSNALHIDPEDPLTVSTNGSTTVPTGYGGMEAQTTDKALHSSVQGEKYREEPNIKVILPHTYCVHTLCITLSLVLQYMYM